MSAKPAAPESVSVAEAEAEAVPEPDSSPLVDEASPVGEADESELVADALPDSLAVVLAELLPVCEPETAVEVETTSVEVLTAVEPVATEEVWVAVTLAVSPDSVAVAVAVAVSVAVSEGGAEISVSVTPPGGVAESVK